jgi:Cu/Zn superoxide dismutase
MFPPLLRGSGLAALAAVALAAPASAAPSTHVDRGRLTDLRAQADATDGARARLVVTEKSHKTRFVLRLEGLDDDAGRRFGAHLHVGPCVAGDGMAAGPHYTSDSSKPASPTTEVWLDFKVRRSGRARSVAVVPFTVPPGGARSVVVHELPTDPGGAAGARIACLPVDL